MKSRKSNAVKCSTDFYDYYSIPFPVKAVGRIQKNKYLCSQLEKLHPCFSDDCCFDSRIRFSAHGLRADVVVMQKFRLAEYKRQNHHKPIYIEELKKIPFFNDHKIKVGIALTALALALLIFLVCFYTRYRQKQESMQTLKTSVSADFNESKELELAPDSFFAIKTFFETISLYDGKVADFSWKLNGFSQEYNLSLQYIFPEQLLNALPQVTFSSVTYDNKVPLMSAQFKGALQSSDFLANETVAVNELSAAFRDFLFQKNINIIEETVKPCGIKAKLPYDLSLFKSLLEYCVKEEIPFSSLSINMSKDGVLFYAGISTSQIKNQGDFYKCLLENAGAFFITKEIPADNSGLKSSPQKQIAKLSPAKNEIIIGKILLTDGAAIEFYKDENGRIKQR